MEEIQGSGPLLPAPGMCVQEERSLWSVSVCKCQCKHLSPLRKELTEQEVFRERQKERRSGIWKALLTAPCWTHAYTQMDNDTSKISEASGLYTGLITLSNCAELQTHWTAWSTLQHYSFSLRTAWRQAESLWTFYSIWLFPGRLFARNSSLGKGGGIVFY